MQGWEDNVGKHWSRLAPGKAGEISESVLNKLYVPLHIVCVKKHRLVSLSDTIAFPAIDYVAIKDFLS